MDRWYGRTAIVTGASSGIGEAIAEALVKKGMLVVGLARRVEVVQANAAKLSETESNGKLYALKCNIRNEEEVCKAFEWTTEHVGIVHVLVNSAGLAQPTNLVNGDAEMWRTVLETNIFGLCVAQREACKLMMAHNIAGHIVNINSIAGHAHFHSPTINLYGASKHALTNICEVLRMELNAHMSRVKITSISPGQVTTPILSAEFTSQKLAERLKYLPAMETKDIVDAVLYTLGTPPNVMVNEIIMRPVGNPK